MLYIKIQEFQDVALLIKTISKQGVDALLRSRLIETEEKDLIRKFYQFCNLSEIDLLDFNDNNNELQKHFIIADFKIEEHDFIQFNSTDNYIRAVDIFMRSKVQTLFQSQYSYEKSTDYFSEHNEKKASEILDTIIALLDYRNILENYEYF